ncbi:MAG: hypothetical protein U5R46_06755 [Gammaproteobacteria bacterium]|nr:hypothetical protein [Gammaproteobacteria bacterium]
MIAAPRLAGAGLIAVLLSGLFPAPARATEYIPRDEWPSIQRGIQVTQYARLAGIVNEFDRRGGASIVISYPGGEAGHNWAIEIRDWFVALGIPSRMIVLRPGSGVPETVALDVEDRGSGQR